MKKKIAICVFLCVVILVVAGVCMWIMDNQKNSNVNSDSDEIISSKVENQYVQEFESSEYHARIAESDTKEYAILFIETNAFEGKKQIRISYDSGKYILNTANPLLDSIKLIENDGIKSFEIEVESTKNYNINFIKKNIDNAVIESDITFELAK